tara:strand:+ start:82 stop:318 length:237 start_codon:yes stop_codon:yes gene_type:complete
MLETLMTDHPNVEIIWNFFPLEMIVPLPVRAILNTIFFVFYIPFLPFITFWNIGPEGFIMVTTNMIWMLFLGALTYIL